MSETDAEMMLKAIEVARDGDPSPNPHVGCVITQKGLEGPRIIAQACHREAGEDHAEIAAMREAGEQAKGGTLYVTLEPCNHDGRTPPCVQDVIASGVKRVVIGCRDPNPHVQGGGIERLQEAGIEVVVGVRERESKELIEAWTKFITSGQAFLSLKLALSLDGRIATRTGASKWITSSETRAFGHKLRAHHDAVMVGIKTVLNDNPRLTVRAVEGRNPVRVLVDSKLRVPLESKVVKTAKDVPTCVLTTDDCDPDYASALESANVSVIRVPPTADGRCDMRMALNELAKREVVSVLCEGGAELAGSLLAGQLVDRLHCFVAPLLLGPRGLAGAVDWAGPESPAEAPHIEQPHWELHGNDAHVTGRVVYPKPA